MRNKYYTDGKERKPNLHEIICIEADVADCEEAARICTLIKARIREVMPKEKKMVENSWRFGNYKRIQGYNQYKSDMDKAIEEA